MSRVTNGLRVTAALSGAVWLGLSSWAASSRQHDQLHAVLWMQRSAEYKASCLQVYNTARTQLAAAVRGSDQRFTACLEQVGQPGIEKLPLAVIADVDETVLDNSAFNARMVRDNASFNQPDWLQWCKEEQAKPVPGSLGFLTAVQAMGVRVIYITNRSSGEEEAATRGNLQRLGYPLVERDGEDLVLTKGEIGDKSARRRHVCKSYRVVAVFGDNLGDFAVPVKPRRDQAQGSAIEGARTETLRDACVQEFGRYWGTRWFMLPNPAYGSWEGVLAAQSKDKSALLRTLRPPSTKKRARGAK